MKKYARSLVISIIAFLIVAYFYPGFDYSHNLSILLFAAGIFSILTIFVKPVINILSLPFNLLTFGLFSIVTNLIIFYSVSTFVNGFKVIGFNFPGYTFSGFVIPPWEFNQLLSALLASFVIGVFSTILFWIFR